MSLLIYEILNHLIASEHSWEYNEGPNNLTLLITVCLVKSNAAVEQKAAHQFFGFPPKAVRLYGFLCCQTSKLHFKLLLEVKSGTRSTEKEQIWFS